MPLGTEVGLGPGHIVLDGDQVALPPRKGHSSPNFLFGPCLLWQNGRPSKLLLSTCWPYATDRCLSYLSVTLVYCGQTV